jgi:hypothetical protein
MLRLPAHVVMDKGGGGEGGRLKCQVVCTVDAAGLYESGDCAEESVSMHAITKHA